MEAAAAELADSHVAVVAGHSLMLEICWASEMVGTNLIQLVPTN